MAEALLDGCVGNQRSKAAIGVASTLLGALAWGFSGTCIQFLFASTSLDPLLLTTIRQLGAGLVFLIVLVTRYRETLAAILNDRATLVRIGVFGSCGLFLNSALYAATISYTNAGTATVLQSLNIVMALAVTCCVAARLPRKIELLALACALAATFFISTHGNPSQLVLPLPGLVLGLLTAAAATFYTMYPRRLFDRWGSVPVTGLGMLAGGLAGIAVNLVTGTFARPLPAIDATGALVLVVAVLVGTCLSYGLFLHGISIVGPVAGNMLGAAEPVSATVISALWLGTSFVWADWVGLALMVATILIIAAQPSET